MYISVPTRETKINHVKLNAYNKKNGIILMLWNANDFFILLFEIVFIYNGKTTIDNDQRPNDKTVRKVGSC